MNKKTTNEFFQELSAEDAMILTGAITHYIQYAEHEKKKGIAIDTPERADHVIARLVSMRESIQGLLR